MESSRRRAAWAAAVLAGIIGAIIAIGLFGRPVYHIGALDVRFSVSPALPGETRISVPPLGRIAARTHPTPLALHASIEEASMEDLRAILIHHPDGKSLMRDIARDARRAAMNFALRLLMLAALGGAAGVFLFRAGRSLGLVALGAVSGAALTAAALALTLTTYNASAFKDPQMTNALKATPWLVELFREGIVKIEEIDAHVRTAAVNIYKIESTISGMVSTGDSPDQMRILAISDLHNNTIAIGFADDLAKLFDVDLILDAGDLTDLGTGFESDLAAQVSRFDCPHVFVTGNHDSVETVAALRRIHNTLIPNEQVVKVAGLRILGQHDPASRESGIRRLLSTPKQTAKAVRSLQSALGRLSEPPDILLVHEPAVAKRFVGKVPIIVSGHDHTLAADNINGTAWIRPGTTGASGIRYFMQGTHKAVTAVIIYITRPPKPKVVAVDLIRLTGADGEFTVTRKKL